MTDVYTKAVLTVIAVALVGLAVRPIIGPGRVDAQGPMFEQRLDRLEHNTEVMRSAANANAHGTNVRFSRVTGGGVDGVLVDADAAGVMGARSEPAIQLPRAQTRSDSARERLRGRLR
jgi:hypothetical protein